MANEEPGKNKVDNSKYDSNKLSWELETELVGDDFDLQAGGPCARISVLKLRYPKRSFDLGWKSANGFTKNFRVENNLDNHNLMSVVAKAQAYIAEKNAKLAAGRELEEQVRKDREAKLAQLMEEKKAKQEAKKRRHLQNLDRRREQDRNRTSVGKGGNKQVLSQ